MNHRERYLETMLFGKPDKITFAPGEPRESTLEAWSSQGMEGDDWHRALIEAADLPNDIFSPPKPDLGVSFVMEPMFEEKTIEQRESSLVVQDWKGNICEILNVYDATYLREPKDFVTRRWIKLPVENREDWEAMKERYDPRDPNRYADDFEERCRAARDRNAVLQLEFPGPFWQLREWVGAEELCELFLMDPDFTLEMIEFWRDFISEMLRGVLDRVSVDRVLINEDMAFKERSFISPQMTRDFLLPTWRQWSDQLRAAGVPLFDVDSDGYAGDLIPIWIDAGFTASGPNEVAAGSLVADFRERFGRKMAYWGGIDKRIMAKGGEEIRKHLEATMRPMLPDGGYMPSCDHGVPADVSWPNFVEYSRLLAGWTGWV